MNDYGETSDQIQVQLSLELSVTETNNFSAKRGDQ